MAPASHIPLPSALHAACASTSAPDEKQQLLGQFFSPRAVADLLASFVKFDGSDVRMLEAGAGAGALIAATVRHACSAKKQPRSFAVDAWEIDDAVIPALKRTLDECAQLCAAAGICFEAHLHQGDFIAVAVERTRDDWFASDARGYTLAVLNPPYRKISGDSRERLLLRSSGIETSNLYTGFLALAARMLEPHGQLVAITPRSFCNGPYFRPFREDLLSRLALRRVHVFESRSAAFRGDAVLQENVIIHAVRENLRDTTVMISSSSGEAGATFSERAIPLREVVKPDDTEQFIRLPSDDRFADAASALATLDSTLESLGVNVSTGRVVDFRARDFLRQRARFVATEIQNEILQVG